MGKKIIVLNGSPRANGNTSGLVQAFMAGAEGAGHTGLVFHLQSMNIHGCLGCLGGGKNPENPCVQQDDMALIYPHYRQADVVVLASPMYYWSITGQLKCAIDRLFAVAEMDPKYANPKKECVLLMAAEGDDEGNFAPVRHYYQALLSHLKWRDRGLVYAGGNLAVGDIQGKPALEEARALGAAL
nr:NAD(P)H-dependent oxidoreductase [bacterium]